MCIIAITTSDRLVIISLLHLVMTNDTSRRALICMPSLKALRHGVIMSTYSIERIEFRKFAFPFRTKLRESI